MIDNIFALINHKEVTGIVKVCHRKDIVDHFVIEFQKYRANSIAIVILYCCGKRNDPWIRFLGKGADLCRCNNGTALCRMGRRIPLRFCDIGVAFHRYTVRNVDGFVVPVEYKYGYDVVTQVRNGRNGAGKLILELRPFKIIGVIPAQILHERIVFFDHKKEVLGHVQITLNAVSDNI